MRCSDFVQVRACPAFAYFLFIPLSIENGGHCNFFNSANFDFLENMIHLAVLNNLSLCSPFVAGVRH